MNVAIIGSVSSSEAVLQALHRGGVPVVGVLGLDPQAASAVSDFRDLRPAAQAIAAPFGYFRKLSEPHVEQFIRDCRPDLLWVVGLSQMAPRELISLAPGGAVGFHPTMLPRGRGRAPVAWTIILGEPAAVSLFYLTDRADAGDLIAQRPVLVRPDDYARDLIDRTNNVLGEVVMELAPAIRGGRLPRHPQHDGLATYYPKRTPDDGLIDWCHATESIYRLVRGVSHPYPGAFTFAEKRKLIVWRGRPASPREVAAAQHDPPGRVLAVGGEHGTLVRTIDGGFWLARLECADRQGPPTLRRGMMLGATRPSDAASAGAA